MKTGHPPAGPASDEGRLLENQANQLPGPSGALTREILIPAVVVVLGSIMTILPGFRGGIGQAAALAASSPHAADAIAGAFAVSFAVALAITVLALVPALLLPGRAATQGRAHEEGKHHD
jgi:hypothetical protein